MVVTVNDKVELVVPPQHPSRGRYQGGDRVEFRVADGVIRIVPEVVSPDEYSLAQRQAIDRELAEAQQGTFHGPFDTAADMISHLQARIKRPGLVG